MLYVSLVPALVVLFAAKWAARPVPEPVPVYWGRFVPFGLGAFCAPVAMLMWLPVVSGLVLLLLLALAAWPRLRRRVRGFWPVGIAAALVAYGVAGWFALHNLREQDRLREKYPLVSVVGRAPEPPAEGRLAHPDGTAWFVSHEGAFAQGLGWRANQLRRLHQHTTLAFVNSDGFGVARMSGIITEAQVKPPERPEVPPQPGSPAVWPPGEPFDPSPARGPLAAMHLRGLDDFVYPDGWGHVRDRARVAGFVAHRFSEVPKADAWAVHRVELVGLLRHREPRVYLSDKLPAMDELRAAPTRPLDAFETAGLAAVRAGEEGFAAQKADVLRYLGAVRSARQCVDCHGGHRGDLLGAFSYTLRR